MRRNFLVGLAAALFLGVTGASAQAVTAAVAGLAPPDACPRPVAGALVAPPANVYSRFGRLDLTLEYHTAVDEFDRTLFCFRTPEGLQSPSLHVRPGDTLNITLKNMLPSMPAGAPGAAMQIASDVGCGALTMSAASVNMHFHGTNTRPSCHSDEVVHTLVNSGQ